MIDSERQTIFAAARDALLERLPNAWAIYVFGSLARGDEWPNSDLDLGVLLPPGETISDLLGLVSHVSTRVNRDVDLVDLRTVDDILRSEVLADGQVIFVSQPGAVLDWEASAMSRQARHREDIREILEDFRRSGVGYRRS